MLDTKEARDNHRGAFARARSLRKARCPVCKMWGCICQLSLEQWLNPDLIIKGERCPNCGLFLCDCPRDANEEVIVTGAKR